MEDPTQKQMVKVPNNSDFDMSSIYIFYYSFSQQILAITQKEVTQTTVPIAANTIVTIFLFLLFYIL
ncbi:hypothetical protein BFP77_03595 [Maribacter sp. 4U21]|nr:hypothetical protein BFP77_03595 [Maribacter sp. 4U21]